MHANEPNAVARAVRQNIRKMRQKQRLTLEGLAARSGVSKGMVVQIEQGRSSPSLTTLARLAYALGVSLPRLVEVGPAEPVRVLKADEQMKLWTGRRGGEGHLLASADDPTSLQLWSFRLEPGDVHRALPQAQGTVEIIHVREGRLDLLVGHHSCRVVAGESVVFRPVCEHEYANNGDTPLRMTIASTEPATHASWREN